MAVLDGLSDIPSKASELAKDLAPITGAAAFLYAVDSKFLASNVGSSYPFNTQGVQDMVHQVTGLNIPGMSSGSISTKTFNISAVLNKGTAVAVGLYLLKDMLPNKWTRLAYNIGFAPAIGYGIGRIFDDPPVRQGTGNENVGPYRIGSNTSAIVGPGATIGGSSSW